MTVRELYEYMGEMLSVEMDIRSGIGEYLTIKSY